MLPFSEMFIAQQFCHQCYHEKTKTFATESNVCVNIPAFDVVKSELIAKKILQSSKSDINILFLEAVLNY